MHIVLVRSRQQTGGAIRLASQQSVISFLQSACSTHSWRPPDNFEGYIGITDDLLMEDCVNPEFFEELQRVVVSTKGDGTSSVEDAHGARITHCERKDCGQLDHWRHHRSRQPKKNSFDKHLLVR